MLSSGRRSLAGGVDCNIPAHPDFPMTIWSLPRGGAWIATRVISRANSGNLQSLPRGGRGLQHDFVLADDGDVLVAPSRGGVDCNIPAGLAIAGLSESLPRGGAWIATPNNATISATTASLPRGGAWIATLKISKSGPSRSRRSLAGGRGLQHPAAVLTHREMKSLPRGGGVDCN